MELAFGIKELLFPGLLVPVRIVMGAKVCAFFAEGAEVINGNAGKWHLF